MGGADLVQYVASGLVVGGIYALVGLGFVIVFGVTRIVNFAQGEMVAVGALTVATLTARGVGLPLACAAAVAAGGLAAALVQRVALRPLRHATPLAALIVTIGASIALRGLALVGWGTDPYAVPAFSPGPPVQVAGAVVVRQGLWVLAVAGAVFAGLGYFFNRTYAGAALRACAANPRGARLVGMRVDRMALGAFALAGAVGAIAGAVVAPITYATYDMGLLLGLKGFVAAMLGGLTSAPGAIAGGFALGLAESLGAGLVSSAYKDAVAFIVLIVVCLAQVAGWLPWRVAEES
jgi:branched-chain amino acid transport system permease protein